MATYKTVMRPALEYASSIWSPIAYSISSNKLQVMQNVVLWTATGCTHTYKSCMIRHLYFPYTRTCRSMPHNRENTTTIRPPTQTHIISSTASTYVPRCHPLIYGHCWMVNQGRKIRILFLPLARIKVVSRQQQP